MTGLDVSTQQTTFYVSASIFDDGPAIMTEVASGFKEAFLDMRDGPRLGPGRRELELILRPARRARALRDMLAEMGRPAGPIVLTRSRGDDRR